MAYLIIIIICSIIIYVTNALTNPVGSDLPWVYYLIALAIFVAGSFIIDALVAIIGRKLPYKMVDPSKGMTKPHEKEIKFFKAIKVEKWKKFMPDLGRFTNFPKGNLMDPYNNEYIKRYIVEASYGIWIHYMSAPATLLLFFLIFIDPSNVTIWTVGLPVMIINMILIVLPAFSLKFNLARLIRIAEINDRLLAKKKQQEQEE